MLDAGWDRGEVAFQKHPDAESTFTDRGGRDCRAPNREIFGYLDRLHPTLAFGSDLELSRFLVARGGPEFDVAPWVGALARWPLGARAVEPGPTSAAAASAPRVG